jgi:quinoprotein glucose dehydrogenase
VPGNVGGVNWGGAAYDPQHHLLIANTNRPVAWVKMIPKENFGGEREKDQTNRIYGEFANQDPAPFGMYRTFLFSPSRTPCNTPPWGTTVAVDLFTEKKTWDVPLGTMIPGKETGSINLGGPMVTAGGFVFTSAAMDLYLRVRFRKRQRIVEISITGRGTSDSHDISNRWQAIRGDRRRWTREAPYQARG